MTAISVNGVGKSFRSYRSEWLRFGRWFGFPGKPSGEIWTLRNVSFDIKKGEAVGIVGQNGAGKSTLLKIITGTLHPSEGSVHVDGRISAILELGMGFNPDLTGYQNVHHSAGLMGFSSKEIEKMMPLIESFADVGHYFNQPVRVYSSGMQVRVAFAVATAWRPEVLIIDEALSVGDAAFQRKCYKRIEEYQSQGTTLLFVTHDIETVKKICSRALFLRDGKTEMFGDSKIVCDEYERILFGKQAGMPKKEKIDDGQLINKPQTSNFDPSLVPSCATIYGNDKVRISDLKIKDITGEEINVTATGNAFSIILNINVGNEDVYRASLHIQVKTMEGVVIYGVNSEHINYDSFELLANKNISVKFTLENRLSPGTYFITCGIKEGGVHGEEFCCRMVDALVLKVIDRDNSTIARGVIDMRAEMQILSIK